MNSLIEEIQGRWKVTCRGLAVPLNRLGDEKEISGYLGHNIIDGNEWGWFNINIDEHDPNVLRLDYDDPRNPRLLRKVYDLIVKDKKGWLGKLFYDDNRILDFRMDRIELHTIEE